MAQQVSAKRAATFSFATGRDSESLLDSLVGLLFGHRDLSELLVSNNHLEQRPGLKPRMRGREYKHRRQAVPVHDRRKNDTGSHRVNREWAGSKTAIGQSPTPTVMED